MTVEVEYDPHGARHEWVIVAGASAGGVEALLALMRSLPADFPHAVLVVLHVAPTGTSVLPSILARACNLPVGSPRDGDWPRRGHVYVAPPDCHLVVNEGRLRLSQAPRENGHRPAIDPTMRTAAAAYDGRTIGIVLSGSRDDGTAGMLAIKRRGGQTIVQDPDEALYPAMPRSAIDHVEIDAVLPISGMAGWILEHSGQAPPPPVLAGGGTPMAQIHDEAPGRGTRYTCPDCGGVLYERQEGPLERFECSVGHVFSIESLSVAQAEALEGSLWAAVRSLEDRAAMLRRSRRRAENAGHTTSSRSFEDQCTDALARAASIREAISGLVRPEAAA